MNELFLTLLPLEDIPMAMTDQGSLAERLRNRFRVGYIPGFKLYKCINPKQRVDYAMS